MIEEVQLFIYLYNLFSKLDPMETTNIALTLMLSIIVTMLVKVCINYSKRTFLNTNTMLKKDGVTHSEIAKLKESQAELKDTQEGIQDTIQEILKNQNELQRLLLGHMNNGKCDAEKT